MINDVNFLILCYFLCVFKHIFLGEALANSDVKCEAAGDAGVSCRISTQTANAKGGGAKGKRRARGLSHVVPFKSLFESAFGECEREAGKKGRVSLIRNNFTSGICLKIHVK